MSSLAISAIIWGASLAARYYTLTYESRDDRLSGVYRHLGVHQDFDVVFMRTGQN
jgi:hypothetical protein